MGFFLLNVLTKKLKDKQNIRKKSTNIKHALFGVMVDYKEQIFIAYRNSDRIPDIHNTTEKIKWGYNLWRHRLSMIMVNKFDILTSDKRFHSVL